MNLTDNEVMMLALTWYAGYVELQRAWDIIFPPVVEQSLRDKGFVACNFCVGSHYNERSKDRMVTEEGLRVLEENAVRAARLLDCRSRAAFLFVPYATMEELPEFLISDDPDVRNAAYQAMRVYKGNYPLETYKKHWRVISRNGS